MSLSYSIARRLFGHRDDEQRVSRSAVTIAMWGVAVGLAVMILSVCIVLGFKNEVRQKVIGFGGHIQIINYQSQYSSESRPIVIDNLLMHRLERVEGVRHLQRFMIKQGMLKTDETFKGVALRGVAEEFDTTFLSSHLIAGHLPHFSYDVQGNDIVISNIMAQELGLHAGDRVYAYFFSNQVKMRRFRVAGVYQTHLREFDNLVAYVSLATVRQLNGWEDNQCSGAEVLVDHFDHLKETASAVATAINRKEDHYGNTYTSPTIEELYPSIFAWLSLLDTNVWVILSLMLGISLFTMISGLLIIILERTHFIAVMKSLGASNGLLRRIFLYLAVLIVGRGMLLGNVLGIGFALLQQHFGWIHLDPATYYVDTVPIILSWPLILCLNVATLFISVAVLVVPTALVSRIHPATVMRAE